jgi:hypothetical protein
MENQHINPDCENLKCNACGYETEKEEEVYWDGCIDCMGYCE